MANRTEDKKPLTVKLYKPTHAKLKIYATLNEKSLDEVITEMITEVTDINIVKFVEEGLNKLEEESKDEYIDEFEAELTLIMNAAIIRFFRTSVSDSVCTKPSTASSSSGCVR